MKHEKLCVVYIPVRCSCSSAWLIIVSVSKPCLLSYAYSIFVSQPVCVSEIPPITFITVHWPLIFLLMFLVHESSNFILTKNSYQAAYLTITKMCSTTTPFLKIPSQICYTIKCIAEIFYVFHLGINSNLHYRFIMLAAHSIGFEYD